MLKARNNQVCFTSKNVSSSLTTEMKKIKMGKPENANDFIQNWFVTNVGLTFSWKLTFQHQLYVDWPELEACHKVGVSHRC